MQVLETLLHDTRPLMAPRTFRGPNQSVCAASPAPAAGPAQGLCSETCVLCVLLSCLGLRACGWPGVHPTVSWILTVLVGPGAAHAWSCRDSVTGI